jgi:hypothetical protein
MRSGAFAMISLVFAAALMAGAPAAPAAKSEKPKN